MVRKFLGILIFTISNRINIRHFVPVSFFVDAIEKWRVYGLKLLGSKIHPTARVRANIYITSPSRLSIGKNSKIGPNSELWSYGGVEVGDNVEIGSQLIIHTDEHLIDCAEKPLSKQGGRLRPVRIRDDVYIGSRVTILSGVTIESRVVIAAGAVVNKDCDSGYLYAGIPAVKKRKLR